MAEYRPMRDWFTSPSLGDIVTLEDGRSLTVRMFADLPVNDLGVTSLCLLGDMEVLLAVGDRSVDVLLPVETLPSGAASARPLCDGAAAFWAPHLPAIGGAMGELLFRLLLLRATFAPLVVINRGGDHVFFLRMGSFDRRSLHLTRLQVSALDRTPVSRFAAVVDPAPVLLPERSRPLPKPARAR